MTSSSNPSFAVVDWGTSSFRLWLLDRGGGVVSESRSGEGMMHAARHGFRAVLGRHLAKVNAPSGTPVLICGMAGARQGWVEAPYVHAPADLRSIAHKAVRVVEADHDVRILPGVAQNDPEVPDVMRGEETQLSGALDASAADDALVCMPGTHSKWVRVKDRRLDHFTTYMTGEIYALLTQHSILQHAVDDAGQESDNDALFLEAIEQARSDPERVWASFFGVRASQLLGFEDRTCGALRLSGLLIGAEIAAARSLFGAEKNVTLIASGPVSELYRKALKLNGFEISIINAEKASRGGLFRYAQQIWGC
ncbi:2-dehydro-3-deoxygalactonokinase [Nitratireductor sp. GISD-1A_MAKvit]|uniref:2-dehydro-3-deoxygalactonokinase n=1 Tax=Nitratireductor sp. GISD-1A_MAKvit TaxID=3234198 RepID=UPI00346535DE